ncbi:hypothetical protein A3709_20000 [Halioglobus sp. HI00S01]|uniref:ClpXP protease specificity-enhancing factor SspB n=1 Tax=Halioglobus sp. HI00S01 TaxID=1822214 RepID=UPI0007C3414E|nr:ClpXP protease specificity-enhancing factor SspB [Halioglobus sp. HI00S01]KZX57909.1 hypothetical protein A3709_20000 [Halioglobus sp. HI00S01]
MEIYKNNLFETKYPETYRADDVQCCFVFYQIRMAIRFFLDTTDRIFLLISPAGVAGVPENLFSSGTAGIDISPDRISMASFSPEGIHVALPFNGVHRPVYIPVSSVLAVYDRNDGRSVVIDHKIWSGETKSRPAVPQPRLQLVTPR